MNILCTARLQYSFSIQNKTVQHRARRTSKRKGKYTLTQHHHGNDVLHRGEKTELYVCAYNEKKKKEKKK